MTDYAISINDIIDSNRPPPLVWAAVYPWIETHQQRRADREIAQVLRRVRNWGREAPLRGRVWLIRPVSHGGYQIAYALP